MSIRRTRATFTLALAATLGLSTMVVAANGDVKQASQQDHSDQQTQSSPEAKGKNSLRVGAAKVDITPVKPALNEYDSERIYVRAIVLEQGGQRVALISGEIG